MLNFFFTHNNTNILLYYPFSVLGVKEGKVFAIDSMQVVEEEKKRRRITNRRSIPMLLLLLLLLLFSGISVQVGSRDTREGSYPSLQEIIWIGRKEKSDNSKKNHR